MGSKIEYVDSSQLAASKHARNSRAVGVLWAIFNMCYCVITCVVLLAGEWVGGAGGRAGPWVACRGEACGWGGAAGAAGRAAAALCGAGAALAAAAVASLLLLSVCRATTVYHVCGWLHLLSGACLCACVSLYPASWDEPVLREVCGAAADQYRLGACTVRWAYYLAGLACLDALVLSALAFVLSTRHVRLHPDSPYNNGSLYRGELNKAYLSESGAAASLAGSRKSLALQPALLLRPAHDDYLPHRLPPRL